MLGANTLLASDAPMVMEYATAMVEPAERQELDELIADCFDVMVDIGWSTLTNRVRFQPASAVRDLAPNGRAVETDLLLLHQRDRPS